MNIAVQAHYFHSEIQQIREIDLQLPLHLSGREKKSSGIVVIDRRLLEYGQGRHFDEPLHEHPGDS